MIKRLLIVLITPIVLIAYCLAFPLIFAVGYVITGRDTAAFEAANWYFSKVLGTEEFEL